MSTKPATLASAVKPAASAASALASASGASAAFAAAARAPTTVSATARPTPDLASTSGAAAVATTLAASVSTSLAAATLALALASYATPLAFTRATTIASTHGAAATRHPAAAAAMGAHANVGSSLWLRPLRPGQFRQLRPHGPEQPHPTARGDCGRVCRRLPPLQAPSVPLLPSLKAGQWTRARWWATHELARDRDAWRRSGEDPLVLVDDALGEVLPPARR